MAPNSSTTLTECPISSESAQLPSPIKYKLEIIWRNVILCALFHLAALYGLYLMIFSAKWYTGIAALLLHQISGLGITAGVHRLWSHKSYKARLPLRIFLAILNTIAFQKSIYEWARDHRVHHKYSDTDADPHNATRGFFFSHVGWLLCRKHPQVIEKGKGIDISDLERDSVVMFQHKYYVTLGTFFCFILPTLMSMYFWNETFTNSLFVTTFFRYVFSLNTAWLINSAAHMWGNKPYDKNINPSENLLLSLVNLGEAWHNYHHVFPWDYNAAELGDYKVNTTTLFLNFMAKIGMAYDCKTVSEQMIKSRVKRTGDGSHSWCWGDKDITDEERNAATILYRPEQFPWGWDDKDLPDDERASAVTSFKED